MVFKPQLYTGNTRKYISIFSLDLVSHFRTSSRLSHLNTALISHTQHIYNITQLPDQLSPPHDYLIGSKYFIQDDDGTSFLSCNHHPGLESYDSSFDKYKNILTDFPTLRLHLLTASCFCSFLLDGEMASNLVLCCSVDKSRPLSLASSPFTTWLFLDFIQQCFMN